MKTLCLAVITILGMQTLCVGVCIDTDVDRYSDMPITGPNRCDGSGTPGSGNRSEKSIDPCIERLALESRGRAAFNSIPSTTIFQEYVHGVDQGYIVARARNAIVSGLTETSTPTQRLVLRI